MSIICLSGGFDPLHIGHIRLINAAAEYGRVIVILNSDEWLVRKKGFFWQHWEARAEVMSNIMRVTKVVKADDWDGSVCNTLRLIKPDYFANGGDRWADNTPELQLCHKLGIEPLFGIGGGKIANSSDLTKLAKPELSSIDNIMHEALK